MPSKTDTSLFTPKTFETFNLNLFTYAVYIKREFYLRGIPAEFRSGFKLGLEQAGKLFSLIYDCVQNNFAFEFMKPIVLNKHIPWKDREGAEALIDYGVKNNCAVSWKENKEDTVYKNI